MGPRRCVKEFEPVWCKCQVMLPAQGAHWVKAYSTWQRHKRFLDEFGECEEEEGHTEPEQPSAENDLPRIARSESPDLEPPDNDETDIEDEELIPVDPTGEALGTNLTETELESAHVQPVATAENTDEYRQDGVYSESSQHSESSQTADRNRDFELALSLISQCGEEHIITRSTRSTPASGNRHNSTISYTPEPPNRQLTEEEIAAHEDNTFEGLEAYHATVEDTIDAYDELLSEPEIARDNHKSTQSSESESRSEAGTVNLSDEEPGFESDISGDEIDDLTSRELPSGLKFLETSSRQTISERDLASFALFDTKTSKNVSREAMSDLEFILRELSDIKPHDYRTTEAHLRARTGIDCISYDCCIKSCFCFVNSDLLECPSCHHPRFKDVEKKIPYERFQYIPVTPRLRLQYATPRRAAKLIQYRKIIQSRNGFLSQQRQNKLESNLGVYDWWNGDLCESLMKKGLLGTDSDIAMLFSTDGVTLFKMRGGFSVWPLLLLNYNLPPSERVKEENLILAGVIPGPKAPEDIDSFLYPLVEEFLKLEQGVTAWNGNAREPFKLKAHIVVISADQPAREKLMGMMGGGTYYNCFYCTARGIHNGSSVYYPFTPPTDMPEAQMQQLIKNGHNLTKYDIDDLPMRCDYVHRGQALAAQSSSLMQRSTGIKRLPILAKLSSVDFPRSFPIDAMHLFYSNVIPDIFNHLRGKFTKRPGGLVPLEPKNAANATSKPAAKTTRNEKKFEATDDKYNIKPETWKKIGKDMETSRRSLPGSFGTNARDITKHCHQYKAEEWSKFTHIYSPIYIKDHLPPHIYNAYIGLVEAIGIACDYVFSIEDLDKVRSLIARFITVYEQEFYEFKTTKMNSMLSVIHILAHVPQCMEWNGPMRNYWQFPMERVVGMLARNVSSRKDTNANMANNILRREWLNHTLFTDLETEYIWDNTDDKTLCKTLIRILVARRNKTVHTLTEGVLKRKREPLNLLDGKNNKSVDLIRDCRNCVYNLLIGEGNIIMRNDVPQQVKTWGRLCLEDEKSEVSSAARRQQEFTTRDSTLMRFEIEGAGNQLNTRYGKVLMLFTMNVLGSDQKFAYIQDIPVAKDGKLLYRSPGGSKAVIRVESIKELIGLVTANKRQYIVLRDTCLFS